MKVNEAAARYPQIKGYPLIQNGDVHYLDGFLGSMHWTVETPTIAELRRLALNNQNGRTVKFPFIMDNPHSGNVTFGN
jgi:hypothetical protein